MGEWIAIAGFAATGCLICWRHLKRRRCLHEEIGVTASERAVCFICGHCAYVDDLEAEAKIRCDKLNGKE